MPSRHGAFVAKMLDKDCTLTLKQLVDLCKRQFRKTFSHSTISRSIKAFHYSLKRTDLRTERSETPQAIHEREVYAANFHEKVSDDPASFFFMDEVGFSVSMQHAYGYSPRNKPATVTAPAIRSRNISTITLIGMPRGEPLEKTMIIKVLPCPGNTEQCRLFMVEALDKLQKKGGLAVGQLFWIMSPFHHSKDATELFPSGGPVSLMFLPPASPFFNPIENVFGIWKNMVCQAKARSEAELMQVINTTASKISAETIMNCILHANHNCESYKNGDHNVH